MAKIRILAVDDEAVIRDFITRIGARYGYEVVTASGADEALEILKKGVYPVVLSDIRMPGKNGLALLKEVRERYPDTRVVMLTASDNIEDAVQSLNLGAERYLLKPMNIDEITHALKSAFEKRELILRDREHRKQLLDKLKAQEEKIREMFLGSMKALTISLEAKDEYTRGHSERVADLTLVFASFLDAGIDFEQLKIAGDLHDIGKIGIRESVLNKAGKLTKEEYEHIMQHPVISEQIVLPVLDNKETVSVIKHHHEHFDGKGYPDGLKGKDIPLGARIIALADTFDALTSERPYRTAYSREEAMKIVEEEAGTHFDPSLARAFLDMLKRQR